MLHNIQCPGNNGTNKIFGNVWILVIRNKEILFYTSLFYRHINTKKIWQKCQNPIRIYNFNNLIKWMNKTIVCLIKRMNKKAKYDKNIWTRLKKYSLLTFSISQVSMATDSTQIIPHCVFVVLVDIWTAVKRFKCVFVCVRFRSWRSRTSSLIRSSLLSCGASTPHARYTKLSDNNMHCKIWRFLIIQINCSIQFSSIVCEKLILLKAKKKKVDPRRDVPELSLEELQTWLTVTTGHMSKFYVGSNLYDVKVIGWKD